MFAHVTINPISVCTFLFIQVQPEEIKLHRAKDPWRPSRFQIKPIADEDDKTKVTQLCPRINHVYDVYFYYDKSS